jgi:UDPglucose 6-dehydrogenase
MRVAIVGTGYVGLVTGVCLAEKGLHVACVDIDEEKVSRINRGEAPIYEPGLDDLLRQNIGARFRASTDLRDAVQASEITMIAVGTPFNGQEIDLRFVKKATQQIGAALADCGGYKTVVVKSTVVPGTTDDVVLPILEQASGKKAGEDFGVGANPEFLSEGTAIEDFMQPDRIVLGGIDSRTRSHLAELYAGFSDVPQIATSNKAAEMIKYTANSLLATLISFSNEIGNLCAAIGGIDARDVFRGVHLSQYLNPRRSDGVPTKAPIAAFLEAGCGFGGSCLPKDVAALVQHGVNHGQPTPLLDVVLEINRRQPHRMVDLLKRHFPSLRGTRVAVLGLAFKPDTDDVRESPAISIIRRLIEHGADVQAYDPIANRAAERAMPGAPIRYCDSLDAALADADAVLLVTRWHEFQQVPEMLRGRDPQPVLVDGRRVIDPTAVQRYEGIGLRLTAAAGEFSRPGGDIPELADSASEDTPQIPTHPLPKGEEVKHEIQ